MTGELSSPLLDVALAPEVNRRGLTAAEVDELRTTWGYNELPSVKVNMCFLFLQQFNGTMPFMLMVAIVIAAICEDYQDLIIIFVMLIVSRDEL